MDWAGASVLAIGLAVVYGWFLLVAVTNWWLMPRPPRGTADPAARPAVLIPARNEAENLRVLVPALVGQGLRVYVYDDESDDGTAEVARDAGALVARATEPLPAGWTGKNRACLALARLASEDFAGDWLLFLDADVRVGPAFGDQVTGLLASAGTARPVVTGFLAMTPGRGAEPVYLGWVPFLLLATNPFGLVAVTGAGHNRFLNGQFTAWRPDLYWRVNPNEALRDRILEDVLAGRLLARERIRVMVAGLSSAASVRMYGTLREALDGMTKNSYEITGSAAGSYALAAFLTLAATGWAFTGGWWPWLLGSLLLAKLVADRVVRYPVWTVPFTPVTLLLAAWTMVRSVAWRRRGQVHWKGRTYSP